MSFERICRNAIFIADNYTNPTSISFKKAEKMAKEIAPSMRKCLVHSLKFPQLINQTHENTLDQLLQNLVNHNHTYKRKTHLLLKITRGIKNKFCNRMSSKVMIQEIVNYKKLNPSLNESSDLEHAVLSQETILSCDQKKISQKIGVQLLGNLCTVILEEGLYLNEGFLRVPGSTVKVKQLYDELCQASQYGSAPSAEHIRVIARKISMDPDDFAGVFKHVARNLLELELHKYANYNAGIFDSYDPLSPLYDTRKQKNLKDILEKDPEVLTRVIDLLRAVTENKNVTLLDEGALMLAFPCCRSLFV